MEKVVEVPDKEPDATTPDHSDDDGSDIMSTLLSSPIHRLTPPDVQGRADPHHEVPPC